MCSAPCTPIARLRCRAHTTSTTRSTTARDVRPPRGITEQLKSTTGILILPQRQTVLVARQASDVALLSGGRLRLGVGLGWSRSSTRPRTGVARSRCRQEEQIEVLRRLFTEPSSTSPAASTGSTEPHSCQAGAAHPIWLGGSSEAAFDGPHGSRMASSSSVAASTTPSTPGTGCANGWAVSGGRSRTSAVTMWRSRRGASRISPRRSMFGARQEELMSRWSRWASAGLLEGPWTARAGCTRPASPGIAPGPGP